MISLTLVLLGGVIVGWLLHKWRRGEYEPGYDDGIRDGFERGYSEGPEIWDHTRDELGDHPAIPFIRKGEGKA